MPNRTLHILIDSGETTCASEPGKFCQWLRTKRFGTTYFCGLFDQKEMDGQGDEWLQRLPECMEAET